VVTSATATPARYALLPGVRAGQPAGRQGLGRRLSAGRSMAPIIAAGPPG
jgi:hypothetical protein